MAVVELKDDSEASRLPLVEEGVVGFCLSGGEGNDQANSCERHGDSQRSIVHTTRHKLSRPANASKLSIFEILLLLVRLDHVACFTVRPQELPARMRFLRTALSQYRKDLHCRITRETPACLESKLC